MKKLIFIGIIFTANLMCAAQSNSSINRLIQERKTATEQLTQPVKYLRRLDFLELDPFTLGALTALQAYKSFISSDLGSQCRFSPTCSAFSAEIIKHKGLWLGILLTSDRLIRCNPEAEFDHCEHLIDQETGIIYDEVTDY
jgi:putative membrane protein insertion efficiency factor